MSPGPASAAPGPGRLESGLFIPDGRFYWLLGGRARELLARQTCGLGVPMVLVAAGPGRAGPGREQQHLPLDPPQPSLVPSGGSACLNFISHGERTSTRVQTSEATHMLRNVRDPALTADARRHRQLRPPRCCLAAEGLLLPDPRDAASRKHVCLFAPL